MPKILLIDDEEMMRVAARVMLQRRGCEVDEACEGAEGLERARASRPDLIVCDLNMPGMDGFEVVRELRRDAQLKAVPVLVITGLSGNGYGPEAIRAGANAYLLKPFSREELFESVDALLR